LEAVIKAAEPKTCSFAESVVCDKAMPGFEALRDDYWGHPALLLNMDTNVLLLKMTAEGN